MTERNFDVLLQLLANQYRRQVIHHLRHETTGKTTVDELIERLHNGGTDCDNRPIDRERLAIQLHHIHLPKLADHDVVEFDPQSRAVQYQPDEQFETVLDSLSNEQFTTRV